MASSPSTVYCWMRSCSSTSFTRRSTSLSSRRVKRRMAQRDWMGSMILDEVLHARAKRVVLLKETRREEGGGRRDEGWNALTHTCEQSDTLAHSHALLHC